MIWFSPHTIYGYATLEAWLFHIHDHTMYVDLLWMAGEGDIHWDFDTSGIVLVMCQSCSILVQESDI